MLGNTAIIMLKSLKLRQLNEKKGIVIILELNQLLKVKSPWNMVALSVMNGTGLPSGPKLP
jgi:hypothetical protein